MPDDFQFDTFLNRNVKGKSVERETSFRPQNNGITVMMVTILAISWSSVLPLRAQSWPSPSTGFVLPQNTNLSATHWITPSEPVPGDSTNKFILVNPPAGRRFYRLPKP